MSLIYSTRFISKQGLRGEGDPVLVPDGHVYVVKQVTFYGDTIAGPWRARFKNVSTGATLFAAGTNPGAPAWFGFFGSLVFAAGEEFRCETDVFPTDAVDVSAHGYDLVAP